MTNERRCLILIKKGTASAREIGRTHILRHAAEGATDQEIADALHVGRAPEYSEES
jgi:DNA-binding CsgD family transcriptional regulator